MISLNYGKILILHNIINYSALERLEELCYPHVTIVFLITYKSIYKDSLILNHTTCVI